jgi:hypothetical protein
VRVGRALGRLDRDRVLRGLHAHRRVLDVAEPVDQLDPLTGLEDRLLLATELAARREQRAEPDVDVVGPGLLGAAIAVCAVGVVGIGVYPGPWVTMAVRVASTLFP